MSKTVSELLSVLEQIGVKYIFGLIGDSLNPLADAIPVQQIEWVGSHEEGAALAAASQAKLIELSRRLRRELRDLAAIILSPADMRSRATTRRCWHCLATCRGRCRHDFIQTTTGGHRRN